MSISLYTGKIYRELLDTYIIKIAFANLGGKCYNERKEGAAWRSPSQLKHYVINRYSGQTRSGLFFYLYQDEK